MSAAGWKSVSLGEFVQLQRGHDLPDRLRQHGTIPVVGSGGVVGWHDEAKAQGPGVAIGRAANLGEPVLSETDYWPLNTTLYVTDFRGNDPYYAYYLFETLDLTGFDSGSVQPMLNRNYIKSVALKVPDPTVQRRIGKLLWDLDSAIKINRAAVVRALKTAESLYHEYVKQPVVLQPLMELATWHSGGTPNTREPRYWNGNIPWISASSLKDFLVWDSERRVTEEGLANGTRLAPREATLIVVRGMSLKNELRMGLAARPVAFGQDCKALVAKEGLIGPYTLAFGLSSRRTDVLDLVDEAGHGTGRLDTTLLGRLELAVPRSQTDRRDLEVALGGLAKLMEERTSVVRSLTALRRRLVPALVAGDLVLSSSIPPNEATERP